MLYLKVSRMLKIICNTVGRRRYYFEEISGEVKFVWVKISDIRLPLDAEMRTVNLSKLVLVDFTIQERNFHSHF